MTSDHKHLEVVHNLQNIYIRHIAVINNRYNLKKTYSQLSINWICNGVVNCIKAIAAQVGKVQS